MTPLFLAYFNYSIQLIYGHHEHITCAPKHPLGDAWPVAGPVGDMRVFRNAI